MMKSCRYLILILPCFLLLLHACSPTSARDYQTQIAGQVHRFSKDLKKIKDPHGLQSQKKRLKKHFDQLTQMVITYNQYLDLHPEIDTKITRKLEREALALKGELCRIYELDGGQQLIEEVQTDAYYRMGLFEHSKTDSRIDLFKSSKPAYQRQSM